MFEKYLSSKSFFIALVTIAVILIGMALAQETEIFARKKKKGGGDAGAPMAGSQQSCVEEGGSPDPIHSCCPGLTQIQAKGQRPVCAKCGNGRCGPGENTLNCPQDCPLPCIGNGGTGQSTLTCCPGLAKLPSSIKQGFYICAQCGDGVCVSGEFYTTCPQDCKQPSSHGPPPSGGKKKKN